MPGRKFVRVDVNDILNLVEGTKRAVTEAKQDLQIEVAKAGAEKMKELINQGGTGNTWLSAKRAKESPPSGSFREGSSPGRVNTGNMRDSVAFRFESGSQKTISSFGWINSRTGRGQDGEYFVAQDLGFTEGGFRKDIQVTGMFALRDARLFVTQQLLPKLTNKYAKRIARGKY